MRLRKILFMAVAVVAGFGAVACSDDDDKDRVPVLQAAVSGVDVKPVDGDILEGAIPMDGVLLKITSPGLEGVDSLITNIKVNGVDMYRGGQFDRIRTKKDSKDYYGSVKYLTRQSPFDVEVSIPKNMESKRQTYIFTLGNDQEKVRYLRLIQPGNPHP